jgi:hypothetical protein
LKATALAVAFLLTVKEFCVLELPEPKDFLNRPRRREPTQILESIAPQRISAKAQNYGAKLKFCKETKTLGESAER